MFIVRSATILNFVIPSEPPMSSFQHAPQIFHDILVKVMDILGDENTYEAWRAIAVVSRTCKYLRMEGIRLLLSRRTHVNLPGQPHRVAPFCRLLLGDPDTRIPYLRRLTIRVLDLDEDSSRLLAYVFGRSAHLEYLEMSFYFTEVSRPVFSNLCSAFSALSSLKHLSIDLCKGEDSSLHQILYHALQRCRSPLTSVHLGVPYVTFPGSGCILYMRNSDPIFLLATFANSLRRVTLDGVPLVVGGGIRVYPLVEELQITNYHYYMPDLKTYLLCFPSLQHFRCGLERQILTRYRDDVDVSQEKCFLTTIQHWHDFNNRVCGKDVHRWTKLKSFRGSVVDAYVLALPCQVIRLHLLSTGGKHSTECTMLSTILSNTHPSSLRLCLRIYDGSCQIPILPEGSSWVQSLTALEIRINIVRRVLNLEDCAVR